jgi:hypothetical protein
VLLLRPVLSACSPRCVPQYDSPHPCSVRVIPRFLWAPASEVLEFLIRGGRWKPLIHANGRYWGPGYTGCGDPIAEPLLEQLRQQLPGTTFVASGTSVPRLNVLNLTNARQVAEPLGL